MVEIQSLTFLRGSEGQNFAGRPLVGRVNDANSDKVDRVWDEFVNHDFRIFADHLTGVKLVFLFRPRLNLVTLKVP